MNKPKISIVMPGIRKERWNSVYNSILESTQESFELIIVGPYSLTNELQDLKNVKYVKDYGNPVRAQNIGTLLAEGELLTWISDDSIVLKDSINKMIECLGPNLRDVVVAKYYEGQQNFHKPLQPDQYFKLNGSDCTKTKFISDDWWTFNVVLMRREFWDLLGGLDTQFEACPMAYADLACRAQMDGANVILSKFPVLDCDHMPGRSGDHAPIHDAQGQHDEPLFRLIYSNPKTFMNLNVNKDLFDWKKVDNVWTRRFK